MEKIRKSEQQWREQLSAEQFDVTRQAGTERAFTGEYCDVKAAGTYRCICCDAPLFGSDTKFDSASGWPSFTAPADDQSVTENVDSSYGMRRVEVVCSRCDAHLGHVFPDGPAPTGQRYCINSLSLRLARAGDDPASDDPAGDDPASDDPASDDAGEMS